jgi:molecular chaperone GrpE
VTDDREPDEARQPRIRITDRRRFASMTDEGATPVSEETGVTPGEDPLAEDPTEVAGDLAAAQAEAAQYLDHLRRLQAEFDNYRKRVQRELGEAQDLGATPVVRRMLEVLDDFELALIHATEKPDFDRFLHGVELVYAKLLEGLKAEGLERMHPEGQPFDPELHEALMQTGEGDEEPIVADVLRPGYMLRGRVLRPAGVRVRRGAPEGAPAAPER